MHAIRIEKLWNGKVNNRQVRMIKNLSGRSSNIKNTEETVQKAFDGKIIAINFVKDFSNNSSVLNL